MGEKSLILKRTRRFKTLKLIVVLNAMGKKRKRSNTLLKRRKIVINNPSDKSSSKDCKYVVMVSSDSESNIIRCNVHISKKVCDSPSNLISLIQLKLTKSWKLSQLDMRGQEKEIGIFIGGHGDKVVV